jgi:hypothetical protein
MSVQKVIVHRRGRDFEIVTALFVWYRTGYSPVYIDTIKSTLPQSNNTSSVS